MTRGVLLLLLLVLFGCDDNDQDDHKSGSNDAGENQTDDSDANELTCMEDDSCLVDAGRTSEDAGQILEDAGRTSFGDGGIEGGDWDPCGDTEEISVAWDEPTDLQVSPEEVFGPMVGNCSAQMTWDSSDIIDNTIVLDPPLGQSEVTVTVEVDKQSIRFLRPTGEDAETHGCAGSLVVDAFVSVETEDGVFDDSGVTTIVYTPRVNTRPLEFSRDLSELGGSLSVELSEDDERGSLQYSVDGAGSSCSGEIELSIPRTWETPSGVTFGGGAGGLLGTWTATGCPLGTTPLEVDSGAVESMLDNVSLPGVWDDGQTAELNVRLDVEGETSCARAGEILRAEVPARVTYGTSDGRIEEHTIEATETTLWVYYDGNKEIRSLECYVDDEMACNDPEDDIYYTLNDCSKLESVLIQIGIHVDENEIYFSDDGVAVYESHRDGTAWPGSADETRYFNLEQ